MKAVIPGRREAGEPGIYNHRPGVMDSGFSALRASPRHDSSYDWYLEIASLVVLQPIDLDVDAVAKVTAISRAGYQQFASLLCAVRLDAPFLEARDKHGGVERPWLRLLL